MGRQTIKRLALGLGVLALLLGGSPAQAASDGDASRWTGSWGASPTFPVGPELSQQTVRQFVRLSLGGSEVRLRLSNEMGTQPLVIGAAHVALPGAEPGSVDPATDRVVTFAGQRSITMPPGAPALSDPIEIDVKALQTIAVSLYVSRNTGPSNVHVLGQATAYISRGDDPAGTDMGAAATIPSATTSTMRFFLSGVEVRAPGRKAGVVVTLGDSITDGFGSTLDANRRWPDRLAERLQQSGRPLAVVDAGISGNRILHDLPEAQFGPSALARFDRDVLSVPGVATVILMESINDIGHANQGLPEQAVTADEIIGGMKQLIARAHAHGIKIIGATLTPYEGTVFPRYYSPEGDTKREAVNEWIRHGGAFDGVVDFDAVTRDPANPRRIQAGLDVGDHLHPNDAGYEKMAQSIDLRLFD